MDERRYPFFFWTLSETQVDTITGFVERYIQTILYVCLLVLYGCSFYICLLAADKSSWYAAFFGGFLFLLASTVSYHVLRRVKEIKAQLG